MHIFFSAGEPSGDEHAAHLIRELRQRDAGFLCDGFGGPRMESEGCRLLHEMTQTAVMGFWRVIPLLAHFRRLVRQAERHLRQHRPDCVVLVDFPGFNWWIARAAKSLGIPVYYYLPPQLWAWASWRIRRVRRWVDHVICTLPFEYDWYRSRGVQATWVGHPFFDEVADQPLDADIVIRLQAGHGSEVVFGLLPGSRRQEVERNWPIMLEAVRQVHQRIPNARWLVACYREEHRERCRQIAQQAGCCVPLVYESGATSEIISVADACLMVSGSVSLELLARRCPGVVVYSMSRLGLFLAKLLVHCRFISLPNLMADRELMPEIILAGRPDRGIQRIVQVLSEWGTQPQKRESVRAELDELARRAAVTGATARTADLLLAASGPSGASRRAA